MSFWVWAEVICGYCAEHGAGHHTLTKPDRRWLVKELKAKGWKQIDDEWYCRTCTKIKEK